MKVMLLNGSPHAEGCSYTALEEAARVFEEEGISCERVWVGRGPVAGCTGCGGCRSLGRCVFDDQVNAAVEKFKECGGMLVASPVHYASASGAVTSFLDRFFYSCPKEDLWMKPGASIVSCRRGGASAAFDQLNKYFTISEMPLASSCYWNQVHGNSPEELRQDLEGLRTVRVLARNMAYLMKALELARAQGLTPPAKEPRAVTNFIR